jgi:cell filamentation protein
VNESGTFEDPYCLTNGCLRNRLGITDSNRLLSLEARIVSARDVEIATETLPGEYNLEHYRRFHFELFKDVYEWAGQIRTVNISKDGTSFCSWQYVAEQVSAVLRELEQDSWLVGRVRASFLDRLAYYYGELNARHPFREGNGRTLRAFLRQLSAAAGWRLDWSALRRDDNISASRRSFLTAEYDQLIEVLDPVVHQM